MAEDEVLPTTGDGGIDPDVEHETWRQVSFWVALLEAAIAVYVMVINGSVIPPLVVFLIGFIVGIVLLRRPGKAGPVTIGIVCLLFVLVNLAFVGQQIGHPDTFFEFFPAFTGLVGGVLGVLAGIGFVRRWSARAAVRSCAVVGVLVLIGLAVGLVATLTVTDDTRQAGDVIVRAKDTKYTPEHLTTRSGHAVFVENKDPLRHTFTIDALHVDVQLPADTNRRVIVVAPAGRYEYHCDIPGHEDMKGTLVIH